MERVDRREVRRRVTANGATLDYRGMVVVRMMMGRVNNCRERELTGK